VALGARAFDMLLVLIERRDKVVTGQELMDAIWPGLVVEDNNLRQQASSLRKIFGREVIVTIPARGYRFGMPLIDQAPAARQLPASAQPVAAGRPTVAVLPFLNMSGDPGQEYFSDGITQDIVTRLSRYHWLNVVARNTTFAYKGSGVNIRRVAEDLHAHYVVAGSVRRSGTRIRVTAELIDARTGDHKWAERYDRELEDIFVVQDAITENVVAQLEPQIGLAERQKVLRTDPTNLQAWDCYHLGVAHLYKFTAYDNLKAQELFQKSRAMDPSFGDAHGWWAYATILGMVYWNTEPTRELLVAALAATERALALNDQNAVYYWLKARVQVARREYESAMIENEMAISLTPTLAGAHCGLGDTLAYLGRYDEAIVKFEKALELSPRDPQRWAFFTYGALALIFKRDFETAVRWANQADEMPNRQYWTAAHKCVALAYLGLQKEARACVAGLLAENPDFTLAFAERKLFYLKRPEQLQMYLAGLSLAGVK
jgi:TolB-like protein/Tfp pilus assembly protein PilF